MGRRKIVMKKIARKDHRQVTFSKRRSGLFKKASELCTLCGAEIAIVVFSPAGKPYSFGHSSVNDIVDRFLASQRPPEEGIIPFVETPQSSNESELNLQYTELLNQLDEEKKKGENLKKLNKAYEKDCWWNGPIENLSLDELMRVRVSMEEIKFAAVKRADNLLIPSSSSMAG